MAEHPEHWNTPLALPVGWQFLHAQRHSALLGLGKISSPGT
ncbi:hypothetical protein [Nocardioides sp.]